MSKISSNAQAASDRRTGGSDQDGVLGLMKRYGIPITRQNYLDLAYMGEVPAELSAEGKQIFLRRCGGVK